MNTKNSIAPIMTEGRGASRSIAGRSHGSKGAIASGTKTGSPQKWYPQLHGLVHSDVERAIQILFDNQYEARNESRSKNSVKNVGPIDKASKKTSPVPESAMATGIHGIRVKAVPPTDGQVLKYNATTGEAEWTT